MKIARRTLTGGAMAAAFAAGGRARAQATAPFKIAMLSDMSGMVVDLSGPGSLASARMAIEDYGGKVLGRPIELVVGDHLNKPGTGVPMARSFYDSGVRAIFDMSKGEWDLYTQVATIPAAEAFAPADPKACPLIKA